MLRLTGFEFLFRTIPESFVLMFAIFTLSNTKLNVKKYIISSLLFGLCEYGIRMLPINYGVHTILDIFVMIIIMFSINKSDVVLSIKASLITTIVLFILEGLNVLLLSIIFNNRLESIMLNIKLKTMFGLVSLICFAMVTVFYYFRKRNI
ncbi:hypothetical protein NE172_07240 [Clostridium botulinum]|uniref:Uncharacterized protein n=1 Tax=Clostridium botulinum TaxID=1491 RepID=A0A6B4JLC3_CLOBO|nr:hypothetical protein [Clostridium botulinum]EES50415.1 conserved hypothetical protein [Clostridium botulinum E1 str. 'BoNT E Beluga']MBY6760953.1 hypothetical protein [Clostridium botulinum]MBY6919755.1 hypothetical protein [Clostridium botulinum]MCR1130744.1 hypothetical protein [Clostridium botulinum]NFJ57637.1 hypothetical protein [Clostridium botulinum]